VKSGGPQVKDSPGKFTISNNSWYVALHPTLHGRLRSGGEQFYASPGKKLLRPHLKGKKLGVVACACHLSNARKILVQAGLGQKQDLIFKIARAKRASRVAQAVECLPSKCVVLSSKPNTAGALGWGGGEWRKREREREIGWDRLSKE
jgi:hypothetical protein